jgi:predicted RNase H-like HicB family nuclease
MSADADGPGDDEDVPVRITLSLGDSGEVWIARDEDTGVTSQGRTRGSALENLDEAVAGYRGAGEAPSEEELRAAGIDPERNTSDPVEDSDIFE